MKRTKLWRSSTGLGQIKYDWLGIGSIKTWHGYPDARFRIDNNDVSIVPHDDSEEGTPEDSIAIEAKLRILHSTKLGFLLWMTLNHR